MTDLATKLIGEEEGRERFVYPDPRGFSTIGIGCLVDERVHGASGLCDEAIDAQFAHDSTRARADAMRLKGFDRCNEVRQAVLISMCFQLGSLRDWPNFRRAIEAGNYAEAAEHGLDSDWARTQTPKRAHRQMRMLASGEWEPRK
jgi:GH24 family phage-related lysozyme (muramidase)